MFYQALDEKGKLHRRLRKHSYRRTQNYTLNTTDTVLENESVSSAFSLITLMLPQIDKNEQVYNSDISNKTTYLIFQQIANIY